MARKVGNRSPQSPIDAIHALRSTIDRLSDGVIVSDKTGKILICNQMASSILGIGAGEKSPHSWSEVKGSFKADGATPYPSDELPAARALAGEGVEETEIFIRNAHCPEGIWIAAQASPLQNETGDVYGSVVIFRDATKRKEADAQIRMLTNAVEQTADSIIITDKNGSIEYVNPAFERTTGYTLEEIRGQTPRVLKSGVHDNAFYKKLWTTIESGQVFRETMTNRKKSGEIFYALQTITPLRGSTGNITHFVTVIKDVTEQRMLQEQQFQMSLARSVQQQFYRVTAPLMEGFDLAGASFPADATGGDYFDFLPLPENCIGIAVGDVSGHGIGSALLMVVLRAYLRAFAQKGSNLGEILTLINNALVLDTEPDRYATLALCSLNPVTRAFSYANAGHTPGYILDASGAIKKVLDSTDTPLGFFPERLFHCSDPFALEPGEILALLTDGITDAEKPDQSYFGAERAIEYIQTHRRESAEEIVNGLYRTVRDFTNGLSQTDDITAVICKATGSDQ